MRRIVLIAVLVSFALGVGFVSVRLGKSRAVSFPPHTIVYRLTSYDEAGKVIRTSVVIRQVLSDGTWKHTQINPDGPALFSNGKLKGLITSQSPEASWPQHLGYGYIANKNSETESWLSPQLQDCLMFTALRENGTKESTLEAVQVTTP